MPISSRCLETRRHNRRVDEESKRLVTINTQKGLFQYTRLPCGILSAPGMFQRLMESLLQGIPDVVVYCDDILVAGKTKAEHLKRLDQVLARLQEAGLRLSKKKGLFVSSSVDYLGYLVDVHELHPLPEKVRAVRNAPYTPRCGTTAVISWLAILL